MSKIHEHIYLEAKDFDQSVEINVLLGRSPDTWRTPWAAGWGDLPTASDLGFDHKAQTRLNWTLELLAEGRWPHRDRLHTPAREIAEQLALAITDTQNQRKTGLLNKALGMDHKLRELSAEAKRLRAALASIEPKLREELKAHERNARTLRKVLAQL